MSALLVALTPGLVALVAAAAAWLRAQAAHRKASAFEAAWRRNFARMAPPAPPAGNGYKE